MVACVGFFFLLFVSFFGLSPYLFLLAWPHFCFSAVGFHVKDVTPARYFTFLSLLKVVKMNLYRINFSTLALTGAQANHINVEQTSAIRMLHQAFISSG